MKTHTDDTLCVFEGEVLHEDELNGDGYSYFILIADDSPKALRDEAEKDTGDAEVIIISRPDMDAIAKSVADKDNLHYLGNGLYLNLREPYILGWNNN